MIKLYENFTEYLYTHYFIPAKVQVKYNYILGDLEFFLKYVIGTLWLLSLLTHIEWG